MVKKFVLTASPYTKKHWHQNDNYMRNLLVDRQKYEKQFADAVYSVFRKKKYGISSPSHLTDLQLASLRKEIVDWQLNSDYGALTQVSVNYHGWLPITYNSSDRSVDYRHNHDDPYRHLKVCDNPGTNVGLSYNYGTDQNQNLIDINTGGCLTRINLNPSITINNGGAGTVQYAFNQQTPSAIWTITHSLGFIPNVFTMNELGQEIEGVVSSVNPNTMIINFSTPVAGYAYLS